MTAAPFRASARLLVLLPLAAAALTGCKLPSLSMSPHVPGVTTAPAAVRADSAPARTSAAARPSASPAPSTLPADRPSGDLDTGAVTHAVQIGGLRVVIDYWTKQDAKTWSPTATKLVELGAHIEGVDATHPIRITQFQATLDDGHTRSTVTQDNGSFIVTPPYSYSTTLTLPQSGPQVRSITLYVQFDILVATTPRAVDYYRSTALDSITLPLIPGEKQ